MAKAVAVTLGFEEKFAVRALVRKGLEPGDYVVIITGPVMDKVAKAVDYVRGFLKYFEGVDMDVFEVAEVHEFTKAVPKIKELMVRLLRKYDYVIANLSGGMRALIIEVLAAVALLPRELKSRVLVELDTEDGKATVEIPKELIEILNPPELGVKKEIIKVLAELGGEADVYLLAQKLGKDETTVRRQLESLKELGLVELAYRPLRARLKSVAKLML